MPRLYVSKGIVSQLILAFISGCAQGLSISWPESLSNGHLSVIGLHPGQPVAWLQFLSTSVLAYILLDRARGVKPDWRKCGILGFIFSTTWLTVSFGWIFVAMHTYGGLPAIASALASTALALALSVYFAAACACFAILVPIRPQMVGLNFSVLWLMAEMARGTWLTGFGWGGSGYAHLTSPLAGYASWFGVYGIGALAAWIAMTSALWLSSFKNLQQRSPLIGLTLILGLGTGLSLYTPSWTIATGSLNVSLLQGNIPQDEKFQIGKGIPLALSWYAEQLQAAQGDLVIAPETAIPLLQMQLPDGYWAALKQRFSTGAQAALIGMPTGSYREGYSNSVIGLRPNDLSDWHYHKQHLVPFGEFIPPFFRWFTQLMSIPLGDFSRGSRNQPPFEWRSQYLSANICYEDLFGEEMAIQFGPGRTAPTILINISNLAWFGGTLAMDQHLQIARMRALEFERPFALATNTGLTALVDHRANVVASLPRDIRGVLTGQVQGRSGLTPYAAWVSTLGMWPYWFGCLGVLLVAGGNPLRKRLAAGRVSRNPEPERR